MVMYVYVRINPRWLKATGYYGPEGVPNEGDNILENAINPMAAVDSDADLGNPDVKCPCTGSASSVLNTPFSGGVGGSGGGLYTTGFVVVTVLICCVCSLVVGFYAAKYYMLPYKAREGYTEISML